MTTSEVLGFSHCLFVPVKRTAPQVQPQHCEDASACTQRHRGQREGCEREIHQMEDWLPDEPELRESSRAITTGRACRDSSASEWCREMCATRQQTLALVGPPMGLAGHLHHAKAQPPMGSLPPRAVRHTARDSDREVGQQQECAGGRSAVLDGWWPGMRTIA